ncbi:MAG TPA: FlgD immunoglobulin-like domain containing protein [bacterium]|nr:FlgD immunoglobulin-like domain containing protein [bacterium]HQG44261.1 FlgD immunoglobulin-like domain containing protein [bacterium]HQI48304.1 FlgD immunoglobulin-like domain containing protein [bacterium]HQJ64194.1 FlgD immunoglobulin-like domain containing protein [bacterium]
MKLNRFILIFTFLISGTAAQAASIALAWSSNTEPDLLGYRVHYGTRSGAYSVSLDVGNVTSYTVPDLHADSTYYFALTALDVWGNESAYSAEVAAAPGGGETPSTPWNYRLESAWPNPVRAGETAWLRFALPEAREQVTLMVFNALGQRVRTIARTAAAAGFHTQRWDSRDDAGALLAAGVYYIRFQTGIKILTTPVTIIR